MILLIKTYLKRNVIQILILLVLSFPQRVKAQQPSGAFIMSSVGSIENFANNSMAITFSSNSNCLHLQNGAAVLTGEIGSGLFVSNCAVDTKFNVLGIKLFPNPVSDNSKVKFVNSPPLNDQFTISVWSAEGFKLITSKATGYELFQGKMMDFRTLGIGTFVIQIASEKYSDALKFIKVK